MKYLLIMISFLFGMEVLASSPSYQVGFTQTQIGKESDRPVPVTLWYPTADQSPITQVAENSVFLGTSVIQEATLQAGHFPLVLLSHGYRGSWRNLNWLATRLVQDGYIVAGVDHIGTTFYSHDKEAAQQWWQRPRDLTRTLDWLLASPTWQDAIDQHRISAIGHSLGGWTVMLLAGAQTDPVQLLAQYNRYPNPRIAAVIDEMDLTQKAPSDASNLQDSRIQKIVSLDLGLARGLSTDSLKTLSTPALLLSAGIDIGDLDEKLETGFLAEHIPLLKRRYKTYSEALHFSFMQLCKEGAEAILEEESPGDGIVCRDGESTRPALHDDMYHDISAFLQQDSY